MVVGERVCSTHVGGGCELKGEGLEALLVRLFRRARRAPVWTEGGVRVADSWNSVSALRAPFRVAAVVFSPLNRTRICVPATSLAP